MTGLLRILLLILAGDILEDVETNETDCCYHCGKILLSYVSMGTLLKLVIDEKIVFREGIDRFEKIWR